MTAKDVLATAPRNDIKAVRDETAEVDFSVKDESVAETMRKIIGYRLFEPFESTNQLQQRALILQRLEEKASLSRKMFKERPNIDEIVQQLLERTQVKHWALFEALVKKVMYITQAKGEDAYCLCCYDFQKETLFIAREMLLGLPSQDLVVEFLFLQLLGGHFSSRDLEKLFPENYTRQARKAHQGCLQEHIALLLKSRVISYYLEGLVDLLLSREAELIDCERTGGELSPERTKYYCLNIIAEISSIMTKNPRELRENFVRPLQKKRAALEELWYDDLYKILGKMRVWSIKQNLLIKAMRMNLAEGDLESFVDNLCDCLIVSQRLLFYEPQQDTWFAKENELYLREFNQFINETRDYGQSMLEEFKNCLSAGRLQDALACCNSLKEMTVLLSDGSFSLEIKELRNDLLTKIEEMGQEYRVCEEGLKLQLNVLKGKKKVVKI